MIMPTVQVSFEQAVYGSFPFWHRGYAVLAQSAGCRREWLTELKSVCQRYGEPTAAARQANALFALPLECGPWVVAGVYPLGCDDRDRPGALAFHALFLTRWAYRWAGADPFVFASVIRRDWGPADEERTLPTGCWTFRRTIQKSSRSSPLLETEQQRLGLVVRALTAGRRVIVQSSEPIDELARGVWQALPRHVRLRASVATRAFDNANHFDLVALPSLLRTKLDPSDLFLALQHTAP
jgi:hypothetical protein